MESVKGIKYRVKGHEDTNEFASGILALTNVKSSRSNVVLDIKTYENSNDVDVTVYADSGYDMKGFIKAWLGEIEREEEIEIALLDSNDITSETYDIIQEFVDDYYNHKGNDIVIVFEEF